MDMEIGEAKDTMDEHNLFIFLIDEITKGNLCILLSWRFDKICFVEMLQCLEECFLSVCN